MSYANNDDDLGALDAFVDSILVSGSGSKAAPSERPVLASHHAPLSSVSTSVRGDREDDDDVPLDELVDRILSSGAADNGRATQPKHQHPQQQPHPRAPPPPTAFSVPHELSHPNRWRDDAAPERFLSHGHLGNNRSRVNSSSSQPVAYGGGAVLATSPQERSFSARTPGAATHSLTGGGLGSSIHNKSLSRGSRSRTQQQQNDALLRRFALWEERKNAKKLKAVYEALLAEAAECSFHPDTSPDALLPEKVLSAGAVTPPPSQRQPSSERRHRQGRDVDAYPLSRSHAHELDSEYADSNGRKFSTATWDSMLAPSSLYAENKAWGFDEYVSRVTAAREEKERRRQEEEAARLRRYDAEGFSRAPTRPEPFELSCYYKPSPTKHTTGRGSEGDSIGNSTGANARHPAVRGARRAGAVAHVNKNWEQNLRNSAERDTHASGNRGAHGSHHDGDEDSAEIEVEELYANSDERHDEAHADAYYYASRKPSPAALRRQAELDTFSTVGAAIRQQLLFSEDTTEQLEKATSAVKQCFGD